jgi:hypothetical protein
VRAAVPSVAGRQREEGGEAPEDRPVMEGDRRSWYARSFHSSRSAFTEIFLFRQAASIFRLFFLFPPSFFEISGGVVGT